MPAPIVPITLAAIQLGKGIADSSKAKKQSAAASAANKAIPVQDPGVVGHLNNIRMRRKYAENGTSRMLAVKRRMITNAGAQAGENLVRSAGDAPGGAQQAQLRSQAMTQDALASAGAESEAIGAQFLQMETPIVSDIADRSLSLGTYDRDQKAFTAAQTQQNSNTSIMSAFGNLAELGVEGMLNTGGGETNPLATTAKSINGTSVPSSGYAFPASSSILGGGMNAAEIDNPTIAGPVEAPWRYSGGMPPWMRNQ